MDCLWQIEAHGYPTKDLLLRVNLLENCFKKKKKSNLSKWQNKGTLDHYVFLLLHP